MTPTFLIVCLFFPRLGLLAYALNNAIPANDTPLLVDVAGALIAPRLLIAVWCFASGQPEWGVIYVFASIVVSSGTASTRADRKQRKPRTGAA